MANRLASATSPYLLQHKDNPVDWWEWGTDAFEEARRRDVPVLLSIGYAACHWCHVMAHESFEDPATAALMNAHFVCIKVDREERPDVDAVYMEAVQAMTGHGGWPMTAFLTTDAEPFYVGTYFPPAPRHGMPGFPQVLTALAQAWVEQRDDVLRTGSDVVGHLASTGGSTGGRPLDAATLDAAAAGLRADHDPVHGGFGSAPKFPPSMCLEFLLRNHSRTGEGLAVVELTAERMARGGMYDQLAGGFARYSVDHAWVVPHFEKMLYDNALLARVYLHLWRATGSALARRVALETADWMVAELLTAEGGLASALDADSLDPDGHLTEGAFYSWTPAELVDALGPDDGAFAATAFGVTTAGTFEHGRSVLQRLAEPAEGDRFVDVRRKLLDARASRPRPQRDDKVVAAWNGLAVAALAEVGALLDRPDLVAAATRAAELLVSLYVVDGRMRRTSRDGVVGPHAGVLEDYGDVAEGLLTLHQVTGEMRWLEVAGELLEVAVERFGDGGGGFFDTADDAERLVKRPQDATDNATPSGLAALAGALVTHSALIGLSAHREAAELALATVSSIAERAARFTGWACAVGEALVAGPLEVGVVGRPDLARVARLGTSPGAVVVEAGPLVDGRPPGAAYVCRGFVCELPTTDAATLAAQVRCLPSLPS